MSAGEPTWADEVAAFVQWTWSLGDRGRRAIAERIVARGGQSDDAFIAEARRAAESAIRDGDRETVARAALDSASASAISDEWLDRDLEFLERWNADVAGPLRTVFEGTLLGIASRGLIGRGHSRSLLEPILREFREVPPGTSGAISADAASALEALTADFND